MAYQRRSSSVGLGRFFSCCFGGREAEEGSTATAAGEKAARALPRTSSTRWVRRELVARVRRPWWRPRAATRVFGYDAISYALNFEDEEQFKYRSFSSRLPASPQPPLATAEEEEALDRSSY